MTQTIVTFGKYKNKSIEEIYAIDKSYVMWLSENAYQEALKKTVKDFLGDKKQEDKIIKKDGKLVINFGKFYGKTLMEAYKEKPRYMNWMLRTFEDDMLVQAVVSDFLVHVSEVNKRVRSISKVREDRIQKEKTDAANQLASDINSLDKDKFYNNSKTAPFKINSVEVDKNSQVRMDVDVYVYDAINNTFTFGRNNTMIVTSVPAEFVSSDYEVVFLNDGKVYDVDGNQVEVEKKTRYNVRVMSDVYDDVTEHYYKGVQVYSYCHLGGGGTETISSTFKVITVKVNSVENASRKYKISRLIGNIK